ncbi:MAG: phosphodiester glycosidase family protein [Nocardioidaceae bacterium]|nr:phosphodiester glycosidase family protein [Nocardioidaceae bacterium]
MTSILNRRLAGSFALLALVMTPPAVAAQAGPGPALAPAAAAAAELPLGPAGLSETRTTTTLQPGVTLTTIVRGSTDPADVWTVEARIPAGSTSPDPDAPPTALSDRASAEELADRLRADGFDARVEEVVTPATADYAGGSLGWRVRVGRFADKAAADATLAQMVAAGYAGGSVFTGWDGSPNDRGPWHLQVLTIDPDTFNGEIRASFGPDIENRETTSALSRAQGATAAVNAGYFVLDPASGAPGDPAGVGVYDGRLLSETIGHRPALVLRDDATGTTVERLHWVGTVRGHGHARLTLDGIDRVPGLIRNCGGTADDVPTARPMHDFTCTDSAELVAFTPEFGASTPSGPGLEAVLDRHDRVVSVRSPRGVALPRGFEAVQATGSLVDDLRATAVVGKRLRISTSLQDERGHEVHTRHSTSIVNGGPELVRNGQLHVTPRADGFVRPTDPSFYYGFSAKRNPRTFAGVDAAGRIILVTADGRSTESLGLTIVETGAVARALGMIDALNLDGGGSTTMVVGGQVVNDPSDTTGERPVGDALLILPWAA